ncbi:MAG: ATP-binding protein [Sulfitobacter sp.]
MVEHHATLFTLQNAVRETLARLAELQEKSQLILDEMSFETTSQMDTLIRSNNIASKTTTQNRDNQINALFIASLNISSIGHGLESIHALSSNHDMSGKTEASGRTQLLIKAKVQEITNRLTLLPDIPARRDLARYVNEIRNLLSKEGDYFTQVWSRFQFEQVFESNRATHLPLMVEISKMSTDLVNRTLALVQSTSQNLNSAVYHLIWVLTIAFLTALITISLTNHGVIERQFSNRIKTLNHSVSAIAQGNLDHPIAISGTDELGDMARALVVFKQTAEDLQHSNVELEKFAYVAAHDLRSPLRAIHDLSSWITEDDENILSGESQAYLTLLQQRVIRLNKLLNDLLAYARVGQDAPKAESIDVAQLVKEQAQYADPDDHFRIRYVGDATFVFTQRTPLQQIIGNLLTNAVKHHDLERGNITVSVTCTAAILSLAVTDDGPGIEPRYQSKIFELFQTLRPRDEVEGSGLGLAIVKKLTAQQKGKIKLVSDPAIKRGTTFEVSLPIGQLAENTISQKTAIAA